MGSIISRVNLFYFVLSGPLHTLQKLEETSVELRESDDGQFKQQQRLAYLQKVVQNLKAKRDQLKKDLKSTPWKVGLKIIYLLDIINI